MNRSRGGRGRGGGRVGTNPAFGQFATGDNINLMQEAGAYNQVGPPEKYPLFEDLPNRLELNEKNKKLTRDYRAILREFKASPSYLKTPSRTQKIERYSDKYSTRELEYDPKALLTHITTDLCYFPSELHSVVDKTKTKIFKSYKIDYMKRIDALENNTDNQEEEEEVEPEEDGEVYNEDDEIEGDYGENYFDNGENDYDDYGNDEPYY
ncbi:hypothetical protein K502DRAFT_209308 [Neoconidiobolus thromboides FSU 785]|nr:hypothetical protein K502DRAFT_209308 [Neoconidiobolus thromboides FSU 785]